MFTVSISTLLRDPKEENERTDGQLGRGCVATGGLDLNADGRSMRKAQDIDGNR